MSNTGPRRSSHPWSRIGPRLVAAVLVPVAALSVLGCLDAAQHYRDAEAATALHTQVARVQNALALYANLTAERTASESVVVAREAWGLSPAQAIALGIDIGAQLRSARSRTDASTLSGVSPSIREKLSELPALRSQIDAGSVSEAAVRSWFLGVTGIAASSWRAEVDAATRQVYATPGSSEVLHASAALRDATDAYIAGADEATAAGSLTIVGIPGADKGEQHLAVAHALSLRATNGLRAELRGPPRTMWEHLVVDDPDALRFGQFVDTLLASPPGPPGTMSLEETAPVFSSALVFQQHLRGVAKAAGDHLVTLAHDLQASAWQHFLRYMFALGAIGALGLALALATARAIVRPLRRLADRASELSTGKIDGDVLDTGGPYEVAVVSDALNEVVTNLQRVEMTTLALAAADLDNPALTTSVPGPMGESLQRSVDTLSRSIQENEELRHRLEASAAQFHELADRTPDIIWQFSLDPHPHFEYLSPSFETHTGIPVSTVEADIDVFADALEPASRTLLTDLMTGRQRSSNFDVTLRRSDGTAATFEAHVTDTPDGIQGVARDVTEIRALQARHAEQATRDPLTGLANRRLLDELLDRALRRAARSGTHLAVAFLDLDDFKAVNDTFGHEAGDTVLRVTAARLQAALRDADVVARYGGDEFIVVCEAVDDEAIARLAERIEAALAVPVDVGNGTFVHCPPSLGIAGTHAGEHQPAELIDAADRAMLEVKRARQRHAPQ